MPRMTFLDELDSDASVSAGQLVVDLIADYLSRAHAAEGPVSTALAPAEIAERFDEQLPRKPQPFGAVLRRVERDILCDANRLAHPMSMGHQVSPPLSAAIWTDALISALNQSQAVWEMSPTLTHVEARVVRWMCELASLGPNSGGTFTSGGTEATFTALLAARAAALPDAWTEGIPASPPVVLCGEHAHYAVTRAVAQLGLGVRNAIAIRSRDWKMDTGALAAVLGELAASGRPVMAVVATAGSTATGSFDDLEAIAALCERAGVWLHVDAAHGGSALMSPAHRHRLRGIERARTVAWDAHKMLLMPLGAGMLLARDERDLERAFAQRAPYLFHAGEGDRVIDQGVRSFACSRRADALKLWVALERYGADAFGELYDRLCGTARNLYDAIAERGDFEALHEPESNILCFRSTCDSAPDDLQKRNSYTQRIRERYNRSGRGWITTTILDGERVFRATVMNPRTGANEVVAMLDGLSAVMRDDDRLSELDSTSVAAPDLGASDVA
jgi:L-2,4-diaminobutyrate decarboxylase